jgi:hypothetical protein
MDVGDAVVSADSVTLVSLWEVPTTLYITYNHLRLFQNLSAWEWHLQVETGFVFNLKRKINSLTASCSVLKRLLSHQFYRTVILQFFCDCEISHTLNEVCTLNSILRKIFGPKHDKGNEFRILLK